MKKAKKIALTTLICMTAIFGALGCASCEILEGFLITSNESSFNGNGKPTPEEGIGLKYALNDDATGYFVHSIGTCKDSQIVIPSSYEGIPVIGISSRAFYDCDNLTSVEISDSVITIGNSAFSNCDNLQRVVIGNSVQSIWNCAFDDCKKLTNIVFLDTFTWYRTDSLFDWSIKTGGTKTGVAVSADNVTYFRDTYRYYYWYKL